MASCIDRSLTIVARCCSGAPLLLALSFVVVEAKRQNLDWGRGCISSVHCVGSDFASLLQYTHDEVSKRDVDLGLEGDNPSCALEVLDGLVENGARPLTKGHYDEDAPQYYWNLGMLTEMPKYFVQPKTVRDIQQVVNFANTCNKTIAVKVHGHSYQGSSAANADILLAMHGFDGNKVSIREGGFADSCGTTWPAVAHIAGGVSWLEVFNALGPNYSIVGGNCHSVSAAGGWLLSGGLSHQVQRQVGLGIDNVVEFQVVLADGTHITADACTNADLFNTLRGGGGGFGVTTSATYALQPSKPVHEFIFGIDRREVANFSSDVFWDLVIKHAFVENRWAIWPGQHSQLDTYAPGSKFQIYLNFAGALAEAKGAEIYKDFDGWMKTFPEKARVYSHKEYDNLQSYKLNNYINASNMPGIRNYKSPGVNGNFPYFGNRLIPREFLIDKPLQARKLFQLLEGRTCDNFYHLGGKIYELHREGNDKTMISRAMRNAVFQVGVCDMAALQKLRAMFPNGMSGTGHNHVGWHEPNWQESIWGAEKYAKLLNAKKRYDPEVRFNCRFCVASEFASA